jgi:hypothetical protein
MSPVEEFYQSRRKIWPLLVVALLKTIRPFSANRNAEPPGRRATDAGNSVQPELPPGFAHGIDLDLMVICPRSPRTESYDTRNS